MIKKQKTKYIYGLVVALLLGVGLITTVGPEVSANCGTNILNDVNCTDGDTLEDGPIWDILLMIINILTAGIGILAVGGVVYASIRYATAGGNTEQTKQAMKKLGNIAIGIIAYALMYSFLNFLIPGGLFS